MTTTRTLQRPSQTDDYDEIYIDLMEATGRTCPSCEYPALDHDVEFNALVCDYCGYWKDLA